MSQPMGFGDRLANNGLFQAIRGSIRRKLLLGMFVVALIPLVSLATAVVVNLDQTVMDSAAARLEAVRSSKANQLQQHFDTIEGQVSTLAEATWVAEAMKGFGEAFRSVVEDNSPTRSELDVLRKQLRSYYTNDIDDESRRRNSGKPASMSDWLDALSDTAVFLQYEYLRANPNPLAHKEQLDRAGDKSAYSDLHAKYHPAFRNLVEKFGTQNLLLADAETGNVVYSCRKDVDFAASLTSGPLAKTHLGRAFSEAVAAAEESVVAVDFENYAPSFEDAAMFLASSILDENDKKIGVLIVQVGSDRISSILADASGLGQTGESFVVGFDKRFRNHSRFVDRLVAEGRLTRESTVLNPKWLVETEATTAALAKKSGTGVLVGHEGAQVLCSWQPITVHKGDTDATSITWALLSEMRLPEVRQPVQRLLVTMAVIALGAIVVVALAAVVLAKNLTRQTDAITQMLGQIGIGLFDARAEVLTDDELGKVALSLNAMCDNTLSLIQTRDERDQIQQAVQKLKEEVATIACGDLTRDAEVTDDLTGGIAESINHMIYQLRAIISNLHETATQMTTSASAVRQTTEQLSSGAENQSTQIVSTTAAIDQMASSIQQVSENSERSANVAQKARENAVQGTDAVQQTIKGMERIRDQVQDNAKRIKRLGESSQEIGEIVQLISDIADRTSILALNASIQAAMAGEAGRGFAVVAEEVERLAERSNHAAKQIDSLVKGIQRETSEAITAMETCTNEVVEGSKLATEAGQALDEIDEVSRDLAELIQSISQATRRQADSADMLVKSMTQISGVTQQTATGTKQAAESVNSLAHLAEELEQSVSAFKLPHVRPRSTLVFDHNEHRSGLASPMGSLILKSLK